ncbi:hypothetical protein [Pedobacter sp. GR22-6]|uniref:hypothetical protein n=1 Tax=Pedobacter sp. GR22-6 TaxID=3127957 RepID=UPI00307E28A9
MKKAMLFLALSLSSAGLFANLVPAKAEGKFTCTAVYSRVFLNSDGSVALKISRVVYGPTCREAIAEAQAQIEEVTPDYIRWFTH